jgi:peptidoglycan/xylan/chitin deacetylase (PgdA/CDA1 family)
MHSSFLSLQDTQMLQATTSIQPLPNQEVPLTTYTLKANDAQSEPLLLSGESFAFQIEGYEATASFVQYKLNDVFIHTIVSDSYDYMIPDDELHPGTNYLRVVIFPINEAPPVIHEFYLDVHKEVSYFEKSPRSHTDFTETSNHSFVPILMYHKFSDYVPPDEQSIAVSTSLFESQLQRLLQEGYTPINFATILAYFEDKTALPNKPILITSDDGYLCNYENAYPLLKKYNIPATFFVSTAYIGTSLQNSHFTWEQAKEMEQSGLIDIQSHSHTHRAMDLLSDLELAYELSLSFSLIEQNLGQRDVTVLAYPQFRHTEDTKQFVYDYGVDLQITRLLSTPTSLSPTSIHRIHVSNVTTPDLLIKEIEKVTKK